MKSDWTTGHIVKVRNSSAERQGEDPGGTPLPPAAPAGAGGGAGLTGRCGRRGGRVLGGGHGVWPVPIDWACVCTDFSAAAGSLPCLVTFSISVSNWATTCSQVAKDGGAWAVFELLAELRQLRCQR